MTYLLPPLNPLRAFEAAARHLSFKLAAHELHVTPAAVGQQVKALEDRLGVRLFERLHKQLVLTTAGQEYVAAVQKGFYRIADATQRLKPPGVAAVLSLGVYARFDFARLRPDRFRAAHPAIGLRIMEPAGLPELVEGKVDVLITRHLSDHPGYRGERLGNDSNDPGAGDFLICPAGTAKLPGDRKPARMAPGRRCRGARRAFRPSRRAPLALSSIAELSTLALEEIP